MRLALALLLVTLPLSAAKKPTVPQLEAEVKALTEERDALKVRVESLEPLPQELAAAKKSRDLAKAEADAARKETEQLRATLKENQSGGDAILKELQEARKRAETATAEATRCKSELEVLQRKASAGPVEGDLVVTGEDVTPARPLNLSRITPHIKGAGVFGGAIKGVVVVNVLVSEKGDVLAARLLQALPGEKPELRDAEQACVEAAKHVVFDPATSKDGKLRFKVWQGVGFHLN